MDQGNVVELDAPEVLFANTTSIFRGMCDRSSITSEDIHAALQTRQLAD
jgi:ATP-binding cassette subfamily C (CFTR/MRP) protein 1